MKKRAVAVKKCRAIGKKDMIHNAAMPSIEVDPETYEVRADGELLTCEPAQRTAVGAAVFSVLRRRTRAMRAYRVGIAGPVGCGKTALVDQLSRRLWPQVNLGVVTNDIYTKEDAEFLMRQGTLPARPDSWRRDRRLPARCHS